MEVSLMPQTETSVVLAGIICLPPFFTERVFQTCALRT
jgi:hypothetical protein